MDKTLLEARLRQVIAEQGEARVSIQQRSMRCGKDCKGCPHEGYYYAKWRAGKGWDSLYLGKELSETGRKLLTKGGSKMIDLSPAQTNRYFYLRTKLAEAQEWLDDAIRSDPFWEIGRARGKKMIDEAEQALVAEFPLSVDKYPYWNGQDGEE